MGLWELCDNSIGAATACYDGGLSEMKNRALFNRKQKENLKAAKNNTPDMAHRNHQHQHHEILKFELPTMGDNMQAHAFDLLFYVLFFT